MKANTRNELLAECACFDLRNATRAVSRMYEDFLRDEGLNGTQFSLLSLIRAGKELSISTLGRAMALDRTSITRALAPLERDGLISSRPGADKRIRIVSLTNKGRKLVEDAEPKWRQAQEALMQTRRRPLARDAHAVAGYHPHGAPPDDHGGITQYGYRKMPSSSRWTVLPKSQPERVFCLVGEPLRRRVQCSAAEFRAGCRESCSSHQARH